MPWNFSIRRSGGLALVFVQAFVALYAKRQFTSVFFLALNLTWLMGGVLLAFVIPAAGPIFVHLFDPSLTAQFSALHDALRGVLSPEGAILTTQDYLIASVGQPVAVKGGGISAMPSIHVATAIVFLLAARNTGWFWPTVTFAVLTFLGSVHLGYHYAIDGFASVPIAVLCWQVSFLIYRPQQTALFPATDAIEDDPVPVFPLSAVQPEAPLFGRDAASG